MSGAPTCQSEPSDRCRTLSRAGQLSLYCDPAGQVPPSLVLTEDVLMCVRPLTPKCRRYVAGRASLISCVPRNICLSPSMTTHQPCRGRWAASPPAPLRARAPVLGKAVCSGKQPGGPSEGTLGVGEDKSVLSGDFSSASSYFSGS